MIPRSIGLASLGLAAAMFTAVSSISVSLPCTGACATLVGEKNAQILVNIVSMGGGNGVGVQGGPDDLSGVTESYYYVFPPIQAYQKPMINARLSSGKTKPIHISSDVLPPYDPKPKVGATTKVTYRINGLNNTAVSLPDIDITVRRNAGQYESYSLVNAAAQTSSSTSASLRKTARDCRLPTIVCQLRSILEETMVQLEEKVAELKVPDVHRPKCLGGGRSNSSGKNKMAPEVKTHVLSGHIRLHHINALDLESTVKGLPYPDPNFHSPWKKLDLETMVKNLPYHSKDPLSRSSHGPHRHHHHHFSSTTTRILPTFTVVLAPIILGICMAILVSFIGMLFGRLVVFLWRLVVRRDTCGKSGYFSVDDEESEVETSVVRVGTHGGEAPPVYEVVSQYTYTEEKTSA